MIVLLGLAGRPMPAHGRCCTGSPLLELMLAIAVLAVASMCLGLLVSAFVSTSEKAMPFLVMLTMFQVILSGGVLPLNGMNGLSQLSWIAPSRWGFGAVASTVNLNVIGLAARAAHGPAVDAPSGDWLRDIGSRRARGALPGDHLVRLRRLGPRRRKG